MFEIEDSFEFDKLVTEAKPKLETEKIVYSLEYQTKMLKLFEQVRTRLISNFGSDAVDTYFISKSESKRDYIL